MRFITTKGFEWNGELLRPSNRLCAHRGEARRQVRHTLTGVINGKISVQGKGTTVINSVDSGALQPGQAGGA